MQYAKEVRDDYSTIHLQESKLDTRIAADLKSLFVELNTAGVSNIILNLGDVQYADSSGLSAILIGNRLCNSSQGKLVICCPSNHVSKLVKISQLDSILAVLPTEEEAREAISAFMEKRTPRFHG